MLLLPTAERTERGAGPHSGCGRVLQGWSLIKSSHFSWLTLSTTLPPNPQSSWCGQQTWHNPCPESPSCFLGRCSFLCPVPQASLTHHPSMSSFPARFPEGTRLLPPNSVSWGTEKLQDQLPWHSHCGRHWRDKLEDAMIPKMSLRQYCKCQITSSSGCSRGSSLPVGYLSISLPV